MFHSTKKNNGRQKKVEIPEELLKVVEEDRLNDILKQAEETEEHLGINQDVTKEVLNMMRGKSLADVTHTILALAQITPVWVLNSLHETLGTMLRIEALKELRDTLAAKLGKETSEEDE